MNVSLTLTLSCDGWNPSNHDGQIYVESIGRKKNYAYQVASVIIGWYLGRPKGHPTVGNPVEEYEAPVVQTASAPTPRAV